MPELYIPTKVQIASAVEILRKIMKRIDCDNGYPDDGEDHLHIYNHDRMVISEGGFKYKDFKGCEETL